jgi:predicted RNA binding protein YcfA (HicA-like mRNA interferase family)
MKPQELMKLLTRHGWVEVKTKGSHHHFKHPMKAGKVTIPCHNTDIKPATLQSILKQAGLK